MGYLAFVNEYTSGVILCSAGNNCALKLHCLTLFIALPRLLDLFTAAAHILDADIFVICFAVRCIATGNGYAHRIVIIGSTLRLCLRSNICRPAHRCIFYKNAVLAVIGDRGFLFIPGRNVDTRIAPARLTDRGVGKVLLLKFACGYAA